MKLKAMKKYVFDINKIEVVGSPTITEDGILTSGSVNAQDYVYLPSPFSPLVQPIKIEFEWTSPNSEDKGGYVIHGGIELYRIDVNIYGFYFRDSSNKATGFLNMSVQQNTKYNIVFLIENSTIKVGWKLKEATNYNYSNALAITNGIYISNLRLLTGDNIGSIDLKEFKIYVDGQLVYSPTKLQPMLERRKEGFDLSKFEVVGSPSITSDGIYSAVQPPASNYIKVFDSLPIGNNIRVEYEGIVGQITDGKSTGNTGVCVFREHSVVQKPFFAHFITCGTVLGSQNCIWYNSQTEILRNMRGYYASTKGDNYKVVFTFDDTKVNFELFVNGVSKVTDYQNISDLEITSLDFYIGSPVFVARQHSTTVDLKTVLIEIDGKEIFNGQKDKYYALRR